jgi:threonine/homoserine/homoserine lactone efflux protein
MNPHLWLSFALAALAIGIVPGPGVMSIVGYAIRAGRPTALASVAGLSAGSFIAMTLSMAGVGALLAASATAFHMLKWAGALYLIVLGVTTILRGGRSPIASSTAPAATPRAAFLNNLAVGILHPKTIVFFVAFAPQFIRPGASYAHQALILILTFGVIVACTDTLYALLAASASHWFVRPGVARWSDRASGGILIAAGVVTGVE